MGLEENSRKEEMKRAPGSRCIPKHESQLERRERERERKEDSENELAPVRRVGQANDAL